MAKSKTIMKNKKDPKMKKKSSACSNVEKRKKDAEKKRKQRAMMSEEDLIKRREKARQNYAKKKMHLIDTEIDVQREKWRKNQRNSRKHKKKETEQLLKNPVNSELENSSNSVPHIIGKAGSSRKVTGRKIVRKERAKAYRKIKLLESQIGDALKRVEKYKKRLQRYNKVKVKQPTKRKRTENKRRVTKKQKK